MAHEHSVYDTDKHFTIDPATRELINQTPGKSSIMLYDHNSERISFDLPRLIEDHDMTKCNRVEVHYINIDSKTKEQTNDVYDVVDLDVSPLDDTIAICSWLIHRNATQRVGPLYFRIRFACISPYGEEEYAWHTAIFKGLSISDGFSNTAYIAEEYSDILAEWDDRISKLETCAGGVKTVNGKEPDEDGNIEIEFSAYTHAVPTSLSMVNAIKRARQLTDVEWTPKGTIPGKKKIGDDYTDYPFLEGVTYKGVPYEGGVASTYAYVGLNVDLDTFFSAVQNPRSILYTYDNEHTKGGAYYGTVCSKFAQGVLNIPASMNTNNVDNIEGLDTIAERGKYNEYDVKLCDIMVDPSYHTVIVTDILYDSFGRVAFVEISEAVTPNCRRLLWTPEEFNTQWVPTYKLCRYQHIYDIPYTKKEYVNIESENAEIPSSVTDPTLMPQYGDKKNNKFKSGSNMTVHILKSGYTKAVVLRDGAVISETDITNATEFTYPLGTVGYIEMYLEDANGNRSESRYACVTKATIEVTDSSGYNDGQLAVKYTGSSGKPFYVQFNGMSEFCRLDGLGRSTIVDDNNAILVFNVKRAARSVRVAYQNEYGLYYSDYADVEINVDTDGDPYIARGTFHDGYTMTADSSEPVQNEQSANSWVYTNIPVEANTTYLVEGATRVWFFEYNSAAPVAISSIAADEQETPYQFTTPDKAWYMSVCYTEETAQKGAETVVRIGATDAVTDMLLSETDAELVDGYKLNAGSYRTDSDVTSFVYKNIPVEQGATYYTRGANRIWLLDAEKASTGRTGNVLSTWKKAGVFKVEEKADSPEVKYVSITYSKNAGAAPDMVRIRKLS